MARQPVVRHNDWGSLAPPTLGGWEPTLSVTVVVPTFNYQRTLPYVLAALAGQSYPSHLLEVLVVDDQSSPPQELPEVRPDNTRLIRVEEGWGRANACHLGALAADGDVLHWYDADMLAHREEVEAHARWHHLVDYAGPGRAQALRRPGLPAGGRPRRRARPGGRRRGRPSCSRARSTSRTSGSRTTGPRPTTSARQGRAPSASTSA